MKISKDWLKELVDLKITTDELVKLLPLRTIGIKEVTDNFIELDMKGYNRADLLSMRGVAYEIAAITGSKVSFNEESPELFLQAVNKLPKTKVTVEDANFCPLYCIAKISGLKSTPSQGIWVKKLAEGEMRSVNNIADVTNLIMLEYGQPMHAFDAKEIKDETLIVRVARNGEKLVTLDGEERVLLPTDLLITDPEKPVGLAGVMGGKNSEVTEKTDTILLEAAIFDPITLRETSTRLGLPSEASKRFQHGLTKQRLFQALEKAIQMYQNLGGKLEALSTLGSTKDQTKKIILSEEKINSLIGVEIPPQEVESYLKALGFKLVSHPSSGNAVWEVVVPYFRLDVQIEEDLIEEVARMYGYEKIPAKPLKGEFPQPRQDFPDFIYNLKKVLSDRGLTEVQTYSFYSTQIISNFKFQISNLIRIANPISSETEYMRDYLWPNLLEVVAKNLRQGYKEVTIFEIGKVYLPVSNGLPKEVYRLSITLSNGTNNPIQELYQIVMSHLRGVLQAKPSAHLGGELGKYFHPTRFTTLEKDGKIIGWMAEIHPRYVNKFGIEQRVAILEIEIKPDMST